MTRDQAAAILLLAVGAAHFYGWAFVPAEIQAQLWNASGAAARLFLLAWVLRRHRGVALAVGLWWACEELLVIGCRALYVVRPWEVLEGEAQCSSLLHYDIGKLSVVAVASLLVLILRRHP